MIQQAEQQERILEMMKAERERADAKEEQHRNELMQMQVSAAKMVQTSRSQRQQPEHFLSLLMPCFECYRRWQCTVGGVGGTLVQA